MLTFVTPFFSSALKYKVNGWLPLLLLAQLRL
jgi:hypothetical protein